MEPSIQADAGSIHGGNDTPADGHAREWWERYLPLLIPLLLVNIYIAYIWPSYPDRVPVFVGWMVLVTSALWFVALRVNKLLKSSEYKSRAVNPNVRSYRRNKRQLAGSMISMGASKALVATLPMSLSSLSGDYEVASMFTLIFVIASLVFSTVFVLVWLVATPDSVWRVAGHRGFLAFILITTVVAAGAIFAGFGLAGQLQNGSPASWSDLLRFAQHEAEKIDKDAVLESVSANPPYSLDPPFSPQSTAFLAAFVFRKPDGASIRIEVLDTDPPRLQSVKDKWDYLTENNATLPPEVLSGYGGNLSYVKISPRDAYRITEQEGLAFAQEIAPGQPPDVDMSMFLRHDSQKQSGVLAVWNVEYTVRVDGEYRSLNLKVDGSSGRILAKER